MKSARFTLALAALATALVGVGPAAADPPPGQADCVAQFVNDFKALFPGYTVGDLQGQVAPIPGYGSGGQAHYLQPFGNLLQGQATAGHDACPFDLTP